jgi:protein CpxP
MLKQCRILAITAAALAMSIGVASAATPDTPPASGPHATGGPWDHHRMEMRKEMRMKKHMDELHAELFLNADQEKLWQSALGTMKQNHEAMKKNHRQMREQMKTMLQQPVLDLNAMHAARQQAEQQNMQLREQSSAAWLNFYNSLNPQQKTIVSVDLKRRFAHMHHRHGGGHGRWGHRGWHHDGRADGHHDGAGAPAGTSAANQ